MRKAVPQSECDCATPSNDIITDYSSGDVICRACGVILREIVFERDPYIADTHGPPVSLIVPPPPAFTKNKRLRETDPYARLRRAFEEINGLGRALGLASDTNVILETAKEIYRDVSAKRGSAIRDVDGKLSQTNFAIASLYFAFKVHNTPRTLQDICGPARSEQAHEAIKACRDLLSDKPYFPKMQETMRAGDMLFAAVSRCGVENAADRMALLAKAQDLQKLVETSAIFEGKTPKAVLAGVLITAAAEAGVDLKAAAVHAACGVSNVTAGKVCRDLKEYLKWKKNSP